MQAQAGSVEVVAKCASHAFSKPVVPEINLLAGLGVEGDAHMGATVKHRSRVAQDPTQPNLRQVHLIHGELHDALIAQGFDVAPGIMGENITTRGIALLDLPRDTRLHIGAAAVLRVTGLRNPCKQLEDYQAALMHAVLERKPDGELVRKAGIMAVVETSGRVRVGDRIEVHLPALPHEKLERV